jgi:outer membrane receptor protein involved in Fe transport
LTRAIALRAERRHRLARSRRAHLGLGAALGVAVVSLTGAAAAEDVSELEALLQDQIVETGSSASSTASVAPSTIVTVTAEDLRRYGLRTVEDAINYAAMGVLTEYNMHGVEIGARGVLLNGDYGTHFLLLVNGLALNEPWNGTAYYDRGAGIPIELVDRIEVMLGPGSVVYGSQAMLGVINVVTKDGGASPGLHLVAEGEAIAPLGVASTLKGTDFFSDLGGTYRLGAGYGRAFRLLGAEADFSGQAEYYKLEGSAVEFAPQDYGLDSVTGEPKKFTPEDPGTGVWGGKATESWNTEAPVGYGRLRVGDFTLSARGGMYRRTAPYQDALVRYMGDFDPPDDFERDRWVDVELRHRLQAGSRVVVGSRLFVNYNHYDWLLTTSAAEDCEDGQLDGCQELLDGVGRRYGAEVTGSFDWQDRFHQITMLGVTGQVRDVDSEGQLVSDALDGEPYGAFDITDLAGAVFGEHTARPTSWLDVNLGARLDADERATEPRLSPRMAVAFSVWEGATLKGIYAEAFRAPSSYELYYQDGLQIPNEQLTSELTRSVEASFEQRVGTHRVIIGVFRSWWEDLAYLTTLSDEEFEAAVDAGLADPEAGEAVQYKNGATVDNLGFNAGYRVSALSERLRLEATVTGTQTSVTPPDGEPGPITVAPRLFGNARASYDFGGAAPTLAMAAHFRSSRLADRYYDGGFTTPPVAPGALDLRWTVSGDVPESEGLHYRLSVNYVTAGEAPYVIGPLQYASDASTVASLQPINRLSGFVGLQYDLDL